MKTDTLPEEPRSTIDTSKMSREQREALEMTEAARDVTREGFVSGLFMGRFDFPAPCQHRLPFDAPCRTQTRR